ncbi:hypothetical protein [uncultured Desulfosarcina sp.]|uniref:hypothetical protein n=1 Tax=uncultured Desulfosarcina sp. TaxID=218289 RepID=UPI0029C7DE20|nr:hypothetical protein [uncultured Desulfosarcina sp.]
MHRFHGFALAVFLILAGSTAATSQEIAFESDIRMGENGRVQGRLIASGERYRIDFQRDDNPLALLVDGPGGQTYIIDPSANTCQNVATRDRQSLDLNPIEVFRSTAGFYARETRGRSAVNGIDCQQIDYRSGGGLLMTAWFADNLSIPVKVVNPRFPQMNIELLDIRRGTIDPDRLLLPADCRPAPGQAGQASAARAEQTEWHIVAGSSQTVSLAQGEDFTLTVADDAADGKETRGQMIFHRNAPQPADRVAAPLKVPNGQSFELSYPASALITAVEFDLSQGGLYVKKAAAAKK